MDLLTMPLAGLYPKCSNLFIVFHGSLEFHRHLEHLENLDHLEHVEHLEQTHQSDQIIISLFT